MTKRTEFQHRTLELKATLMSWVANKLFTFKQTGTDGFFKRRMLQPKREMKDPGQTVGASPNP